MRAAARNQSWLTLLALGICSLNAGEQPNRVWAGEEVNLWGSPSPDGQWLSFVDPASGNLAVRSVENGSVRLLTHKDPHGKSGEFAYFSVFAPDGEQLAQAAVRFAQQQSPAVRRHPPTIEIRDHVALAVRLELQLLRRAPCFHEPSLRNQCKILITKILYTI